MGDHIMASHRRPSDYIYGDTVGVLVINPIRDMYYYCTITDDLLIDYERIIENYDTAYNAGNHDYGMDVPEEVWSF